ncbi:thioredoxin family protein [Treponema sp.]|uniref:thioredoxin family protein n=1 Tax=Treponema sp. TaxID=166 RepID=UPI003F038F57
MKRFEIFRRGGFLAAFAVPLILLASCGSPRWHTDFESAKQAAEKQNKDIYLLFSGDDWADTSRLFKENIVLTDEFKKSYGKKYVLVDLDFSQTEYAKTSLPENATKEEIEAAEKILNSYRKKESLARLYNVRKWPSAYIVSKEGYVLSFIDFAETESSTFEEYSVKMQEAEKSAAEIKAVVEQINSASGIDKAVAINQLVEKTAGEHGYLLKDLIQEFILLDPENKTGFLGKYEILNARNKALEAFSEGKDPAEPFDIAVQKDYLTDAERQEALYMAAYILVNVPEIDFDRVLLYLKRAYDINPDGDYSNEILTALDRVRRFSAVSKSQENQN